MPGAHVLTGGRSGGILRCKQQHSMRMDGQPEAPTIGGVVTRVSQTSSNRQIIARSRCSAGAWHHVFGVTKPIARSTGSSIGPCGEGPLVTVCRLLACKAAASVAASCEPQACPRLGMRTKKSKAWTRNPDGGAQPCRVAPASALVLAGLTDRARSSVRPGGSCRAPCACAGDWCRAGSTRSRSIPADRTVRPWPGRSFSGCRRPCAS